MSKLFSLIKATMTEDMSLFKIQNKNQSQKTKKILPIFLVLIMFIVMWNYANMFMEQLNGTNMEYVGITIFIFLTTILTFVEGIYKSSNLLFNCRDDNLLFSLPLKKGTVLFTRVFKFYIFELLYNSMFLLPAMVAYTRWTNVSPTYYLVSILGLILFPIIPVSISCIIGMIISSVSIKFKQKNIAQIIVTTIFLLGVIYLSFNLQTLMSKLAENATTINDMITRLYYPAGIYIKLITNFNIQDLLIFIVSQILIFICVVFLLSKRYFKINSNLKNIKKTVVNKNYKIKTNKPIISLIKKELKKFVASPVFVTNAGFGLVLFIIGCLMFCVKYNEIVSQIIEATQMPYDEINQFVPLILFAFIVLSSFMTSITSSMISLEGKAFNILKSLPIKPYEIIKSKVLAAILVMIPCIFIGNLIVSIRFRFNIIENIMILIATIILPLIAETIGIIVNLKYPKMNASNDTEVVKQSMSSTISVFIGMILIGITLVAIMYLISLKISIDLIIAIILTIFILFYICLYIYLKKKSSKMFNKIKI